MIDMIRKNNFLYILQSTMFYLIIMKYRSRTEISVLILEAQMEEPPRQKLCINHFLSYAQLKE